MKNKKYFEYNKVKKFSSIKEMIEMAVKEDGDRTAFMYKENDTIKEITYKEFSDDTNALGTALVEKGLDSNHISIIGENSYKWITVYLTVLKSKGVFVPIDKELPCKDIINVLDNSECEVLFFSARYEKFIDEIRKALPNIKCFIGLDTTTSSENVISYDEFLANGMALFKSGNDKYSSYMPSEEQKNQLKLLVYTSGTTGTMKGVMLSEHNIVSSIYYGLQTATVHTRCLSVLPYHHTYEAVSGLLVAFHKRVTICINDSLKNVLKNLQLYKPDYIYLVPAFAELFYKNIWKNAASTGKEAGLKILINVSNALRKIGIDKRKTFFKSIHEAFGGNLVQIVVGGAAFRPKIGKFFDSIGIDLLNGYGITECSPLVSVNRQDFNDPSTVGVILPCCQVEIRNKSNDGNGEIWVKGDVVMMGYYKNPEKTAKVLVDGWFNTEDYGNINSKGQITITGRMKNIVVLENGKNVYPEELENYIQGISYVQEVIVKGIKNDIGQETGLLAEVFLNEEKVNELGITNKELSLKKDIAASLRNLPAYKKIDKIIIRDTEFNKTTTAKIKR